MLSKRLFLLLVLALAASFRISEAAARPNVLLICVDDLKPVTGCYGDKLARTPNIDRLARRGLRFDRAYCNQAVCAPSRNALLTGVRPTTMGIYDLGTNFRQWNANATTLPQHFKQQGYRTEGLGKIFHVGHGNHEDPASWSVPHFPAAVIAYARAESRATNSLTREEALFSNANTFESARNLPRGAAYEAAAVNDEAYPDGRLAAETISRLRKAATNSSPFFIAVGFVKPHLPFCAPKRYWEMYDRASFKLPERTLPPEGAPNFAPQFGGELRQYAGIPETGPISNDLARTLIHGYYAAMSYMDAQVGKVLEELHSLQLNDNTIVILWGDHGWHLGDHGMWCKHTNYEQATRIPVIAAGPGIKSGATSSLIETVDIFPTLCELAGLPQPQFQKLAGRSFAKLLSGAETRTKDEIFHVYPRNARTLGGPVLGRAVRTDRYRLVEWKQPGVPDAAALFELYDYQADPFEHRNIAEQNPDIVKRLQARLTELGEAKPQLERPRRTGPPARP